MKKLKKCILIGLGLILSLQSYGSKSLFTTHVTITTYNAVRSQCDRSPLITADGTKIDHHKKPLVYSIPRKTVRKPLTR